MFQDFYNLTDQPFGVTPDPRFLYLGPEHRETLASLLYSVRMGRGFHALIAQPGMGKTTLLFHLLEHLKPTCRSAFLFQTQCDKREFLRYLMADIGLESLPNDYVLMHSMLNQFLVRNAEEGKQFVLIVDEAQNLSDEVLEAVRLLSDFENPRRKLMHIILAGQPQLGRKLTRPNLLQLRQRISAVSQIRPLDGREVRHYIEHRWRKASYGGHSIFTLKAINLIASHSGGIPRNINNICFSALSLGFAGGKKTIDANTVDEAMAATVIPDSLSLCPAAPRATYEVLPVVASSREVNKETIALKTRPKGRPIQLISRVTRALACALAIASLGVVASERHKSPVELPRFTESRASAQAQRNIQSIGDPKGGVAELNPAPGEIVVVKTNDSLWHISESHLGSANWRIVQDIVRLNNDLVDPEHVEAGQRIQLPSVSAEIEHRYSRDGNNKVANK